MEAEVKGSASGLCTGGPPAFAAFVQAAKEPTPLGALGAWIPASARRPSPLGEQPPASPAAPGPEGVPGFPVRGVSGISRLHGEIFLGICIPAVQSLLQAFPVCRSGRRQPGGRAAGQARLSCPHPRGPLMRTPSLASGARGPFMGVSVPFSCGVAGRPWPRWTQAQALRRHRAVCLRQSSVCPSIRLLAPPGMLSPPPVQGSHPGDTHVTWETCTDSLLAQFLWPPWPPWGLVARCLVD